MTKNIVLFNNKGGVGKTTFNFHLGYALESLKKKILFVDLDPQCNLSAHICSDQDIQKSWNSNCSIYDAVKPLISGTGDIKTIHLYKVPDKNIKLVVGDIRLSEFEEELSKSWTETLSGQERGFRITSAIFRLLKQLSNANQIDYVFVDIGPNLGSLNRAVLLSCDYFFVPLIPDMFSLRGLDNIGVTFKKWIEDWREAKKRYLNKTSLSFELQNGLPVFAGYVTQQFNTYNREETQAWKHWSNEIAPTINNKLINPLKAIDPNLVIDLNNGSHKLGDFKNYHSLIATSQKHRKPIFDLKNNKEIFGMHTSIAKKCGEDFSELAHKIVKCIR
ncbi:MAG: Cobyrinic acid a,c-diamide synthase [Cenarchaeum symbiont of Oopsacas minuta]|nr:Cobyrinic acid a,c-diamide synthase [Cenarchaeum symbiont of Oopsacas minuta]